MTESDRYDQRITARKLSSDYIWRAAYTRCASCDGLFDALDDDGEGDFERGEWKCRECCDKEQK